MNASKYSLIVLVFLNIGCKPLARIGNEGLETEMISKDNFEELNGIYSNQSDTVIGRIKEDYKVRTTDLETTILDELLWMVPETAYRGEDGEAIKAEETWTSIEFYSKKRANIRLYHNDKVVCAKKIRGRFKNGYFYLRPKILILPLIPLFFGYSFERTRIGKSGDYLIIDSSGNTWMIAFISGAMNRGHTSASFEKQK